MQRKIIINDSRMNANNNFDYEAIKDRPVYTLSCKEFCELTRFANSGILGQGATTPSAPQAIGIDALASALSCSASQIYVLQRSHMLDDAVVSRIGRRIVFDVEKARTAAIAWQAAKNNKPAGVAG